MLPRDKKVIIVELYCRLKYSNSCVNFAKLVVLVLCLCFNDCKHVVVT